MSARLFFCLCPAALVGGLCLLVLHPAQAALAFLVVFGHGWQVTAPRPERGERQ